MRLVKLLSILALLPCFIAFAEEKPADEVTVGEVRMTMNAQYAKVQVDGNDWEEHEFTGDGRTLILHKIDRTSSHSVTLSPVEPELEGTVVEVKPEDFKLVKVGKNTFVWRAEKRVTFARAKDKGK
jgi:hypothetical protein